MHNYLQGFCMWVCRPLDSCLAVTERVFPQQQFAGTGARYSGCGTGARYRGRGTGARHSGSHGASLHCFSMHQVKKCF